MLDLFIPRPSDCLSQPSTLVTTVRCPSGRWCHSAGDQLSPCSLSSFPHSWSFLLVEVGKGWGRGRMSDARQLLQGTLPASPWLHVPQVGLGPREGTKDCTPGHWPCKLYPVSTVFPQLFCILLPCHIVGGLTVPSAQDWACTS